MLLFYFIFRPVWHAACFRVSMECEDVAHVLVAAIDHVIELIWLGLNCETLVFYIAIGNNGPDSRNIQMRLFTWFLYAVHLDKPLLIHLEDRAFTMNLHYIPNTGTPVSFSFGTSQRKYYIMPPNELDHANHFDCFICIKQNMNLRKFLSVIFVIINKIALASTCLRRYNLILKLHLPQAQHFPSFFKSASSPSAFALFLFN